MPTNHTDSYHPASASDPPADAAETSSPDNRQPATGNRQPPTPYSRSPTPYLVLSLVTLLLALGLALLPPGVLWHPDEGAKLLQLNNLRFDGLLPAAPIPYTGQDIDPGRSFVPFHPKQYRVDAAGDVALQWPVFLAALAAPFHALFGMIGLYFWPLLGAAGSCWAAWRLALIAGAPPRWALLAIPLPGLATPLGFYSWLFFEHTLAAFLVAVSVLLLLGGRRGQGAGTGDGRRETGDGIHHGDTETRRETRGQGAGGRGQETRWQRAEGRGQGLAVTRHSSPVTRHPSLASGLLLGLAIWLRSELYVLAAVCALLLAWWWLRDRVACKAASRELRATCYVLRATSGEPVGTGHRQLSTQHSAPSTQHPVLSTQHSVLSTRLALAWAAGLLLALVPLWLYHAAGGGGILPQHATWYFAGGEPVGGAAGPRVPVIRYLAQVGWGVVPAFLVGPDEAGGPSVPGLLSMGMVLATALVLAGSLLPWLTVRRTRPGLPRAANAILLAGLGLLALCTLPVLFSPEPYANLHGFLLAAPFVALAAPAARPGAPGAARSLALLVLLYVAGHVLVISALSGLGPISTYEWGQRYILPAYPLLVPLAIRGLVTLLDSARGRAGSAVAIACAALLVLAGAGFLLRGWLVLDAGKREVAAWQQRVAANRDPAIITADWWLPLLLAPEYHRHRWFLVEDQDQLGDWLTAAGKQRIETIAVARIAADPVGDFLPVLERVDGPGAFSLVRYAVLAR